MSTPARPDMLARGLAALTRRMAGNASQDVAYVRGELRATVRATIGTRLLKLDDGEGGVYFRRTDKTFYIPTNEIVLGGERVLPQRGDQVWMPGSESGTTDVYEVLPYDSEPEWRYTDPHGTQVMVHTKHVETIRDC